MADMPLGEPIPDDPTDPTPDKTVEDMTDEQLDAAIAGKPIPDAAPADKPAAQAAAAVEVEAGPDSDVKEDAPTVTEGEPPPAAVVAEVPPADVVADLKHELELAKLDRQREESRSKRFEFLLSREAGKRGFEQRQPVRAAEDGGDERDDLAPLREDIQALKTDRVEQAFAREAQLFRSDPAFSDWAKYAPQIKAKMAEREGEFADMLDTQDPKLAGIVAHTLFRETYFDARRDALVGERAEAEKRRSDQAAKLKEQKKAASITQSAGAAPAPSVRKATDVNQLSDKELDALIAQRVSAAR